eukprot:PhF_6_TR34164/c0_g1_i2/m.49967
MVGNVCRPTSHMRFDWGSPSMAVVHPMGCCWERNFLCDSCSPLSLPVFFLTVLYGPEVGLVVCCVDVYCCDCYGSAIRQDCIASAICSNVFNKPTRGQLLETRVGQQPSTSHIGQYKLRNFRGGQVGGRLPTVEAKDVYTGWYSRG